MQPLGLHDDAAVEGLLRRRRVASRTAELYMKWAARPARNQRLPSLLTAEKVNKSFDHELACLFPATHPGKNASHLFYATRWFYNLTN